MVPPKLVVMVALPAVLLLLKVAEPRALFVMFALPAVLEPRNLTKPLKALVMLALPAVLVLLNVVDPKLVLVMVAVPAVLELEKVVTALRLGVVGDHSVAGSTVIGERQYCYGREQKTRRIRGVVDDAGAGNIEPGRRC